MNVIPKKELKRIIKRFFEDHERGISIKLFAEVAGVDFYHLRDVFLYEKHPLTEYVQVRVSRAFHEWKAGRIRVMENPDRTRFTEYRREERPRLKRAYGLTAGPDGIRLKIGIKNRADYSDLTLEEQLRR